MGNADRHNTAVTIPRVSLKLMVFIVVDYSKIPSTSSLVSSEAAVYS